MNRLTRLGGFLLLAAAGVACTDVDSPTELNPAGPPMVRQVFMYERLAGASVDTFGLAFGTHDEFAADNPSDDRSVTTASVGIDVQKIRVIMDELLIGNYLEEIACRDGSWSRVPEGTTPDDIAGCSVPADVLPQTCPGDGAHSVCVIGGEPIGVLDANEDGAADDTRFIWSATGDKAVRILCTPRGGGAEIEATLNTVDSFWQPSGNQQVPAAGGYQALGPAVVLEPTPALPTNSECRIVFADNVVDKDHNQVCAPADGDITGSCDPGDVDLLVFGSDALRYVGSNPQNNATNVPLMNAGTDARISVSFNTELAATLPADAFTLQETVGGNTTTRTITVVRDAMTRSRAVITIPGGFVADATYTLVIGSGLTDTYGVPIPEGEPASITFTTVPSTTAH